MAIFIITLRSRNGDDGIKKLRAALKLLWRKFGLQCLKIEEQKQP